MTSEEFANKLFPKPEVDSDNLQPKPDCEMMYLELKKWCNQYAFMAGVLQ